MGARARGRVPAAGGPRWPGAPLPQALLPQLLTHKGVAVASAVNLAPPHALHCPFALLGARAAPVQEPHSLVGSGWHV